MALGRLELVGGCTRLRPPNFLRPRGLMAFLYGGLQDLIKLVAHGGSVGIEAD